MSEKKLLSCPFCDGEKIINTYTNFVPSLLCAECGAKMIAPMDSFGKNYEKLLADKWNTRKPMERIVERLEEQVDSWTKVYNVIKNRGYIDDYSVGAYDGYYNSLTIVKKAGGLNE